MDFESVPLWTGSQQLIAYPPLKEHSVCDVCVIGAGIGGLTAAYLLAKEGKKVVVLDDGPVAGGQTMRTTGHLTNVLDERYYHLEGLFGEKGAQLAAESHHWAIDFVASLVAEHGIDCGFEALDAYLFSPPHEPASTLEAEFFAAQRAGLRVKVVDRCPLPSFDTGRALCIGGQAHFHPLKYVDRLCGLIKANGGEIHCGTHATDIKGSYRVEAGKNAQVEASHVVVATNSPINSRFFPHLKQAPYRTYVIAGKIPHDYVPAGLYYDTLDPYHYIRIAKDPSGCTLIVGGEDHRTGEEEDIEGRYAALEAWIRERFPQLQEITYRWSGQVLQPVDALGLIGRVDKEIYIITGDAGNGITHGTLGGKLICDLIHGRASPWEKLYDPHRISVRAIPEFLKENINTAWQYTDWLAGVEKNALKPHCGHVVQDGLVKCAVYKDVNGVEHKMSAVCPHLKAIVRWNKAEHCWECPAHGSRFSAFGEVIQGPANSGLEKLSESDA